jgi:ADP-L-glycero-D-manno-heptose 6-epimerase
VVNKAYGQIKNTGKVQLFKSYRPDYADGEQMRDFVYVKDAVAVTLHFLNDRETGGLFNCGTGVARSWKDLVNATFSAMEVPSQIEFIEMPEVLRDKYQYFTQAEPAKLRNAGYAASFTSLENAIHDYVATYLSKQECGS